MAAFCVEYLEIFDDLHSDDEERCIAIGPVLHGVVLVVWAEVAEETTRMISARSATKRERTAYEAFVREQRSRTCPNSQQNSSREQIPARVRRRLMAGKFESGADVAALRRFVGLTQARFALAIGNQRPHVAKLGARASTAGRPRDCVATHRCATPEDHLRESRVGRMTAMSRPTNRCT